jgi:hypothetical protein
MKMTVFWVVAPCSLVAGSVIRAIMEAASTSKTSVNFYQTIRRYNPEDSHAHTLKVVHQVLSVKYIGLQYSRDVQLERLKVKTNLSMT